MTPTDLNDLLDAIRLAISEENYPSALQDATQLQDELAQIVGEK